MASWASLSAEQRAAAMHDSGPAACYAGPGSGKTRVVTLRAARLAERGARVLVTTFTTDATQEMKSRIGQLLPTKLAAGAHVTTLHAFCLAALRAEDRKFQILSDDGQRRALAEAARASDLDGGANAFLARTSYLKNCGESAHSYRPDGSSEDQEFARAWRRFEKTKAERDLKDFDDLLLDVRALFADEVKRKKWAERYSHLLVDECQDMNRPQYEIALALGRDHHNVMLVGDPDQSLYAFRGADTETFRTFASRPATHVYELRANYRSTRPIVSFASELIRQQEGRRAIQFASTRGDGPPVRWQTYADADIEALAVAEEVLRLNRQGARFGEIAVLFRLNAQSEAFERHFAGVGIPYQATRDGDFYARKEVAGILAYLEFLRSYADEWLLAFLNLPSRKLPRSVAVDLREQAEFRGRTIWENLPDFHAADLRAHRAIRQMREDLQDVAARLPSARNAGEAIRLIRQAMGFDNWLRAEELTDRDNDRIQNLERMQEAASHYRLVEDYLAAVRKVREEAAKRKSEQRKKAAEEDSVTLATGHAAKGREWRCVFAAGWSEELLPHRKAEDVEEERRIAYVMATRARDFLAVSSLQNWNGATVSPSRFLKGVNLVRESLDPAPRLPAGSPADPGLGGLFIA